MILALRHGMVVTTRPQDLLSRRFVYPTWKGCDEDPIDIPDELMEQARQITGGATKTETVRTALRLLVRQQQLDAIAWFADHEPFLSEDEIAEESNRQSPR
ncbi:type II toxin-antitoxin system VapB family antitoxin [Nocardia cyriacigeorgica]|uniref:Type II toxin-antitoxin system VapB family antitoxin n=1 Tax=Nocardia cyriacigeorgica TaxID=135487 RepID=A0A6P1DFB4_9NOCA|nr:type II toxin-antitoxin system VapB family antitoxin [Nocardia cyriacigeorgica]NEW42194.1 type II toxin-antitoxin system VapB family antitoxin [Nocardia cyriacigeorgica]NEW47112.1 type II toxin-antitoxin system VapB family antitoxin [Nocardia cyriacigeorgica]